MIENKKTSLKRQPSERDRAKRAGSWFRDQSRFRSPEIARVFAAAIRAATQRPD